LDNGGALISLISVSFSGVYFFLFTVDTIKAVEEQAHKPASKKLRAGDPFFGEKFRLELLR
jgi:hypothetical protein